MLMLQCSLAYSQSKKDNSTADQTNRDQFDHPSEAGNFNFVSYFNINLENLQCFLTLKTAKLFERPVSNAKIAKFEIPAGSEIQVYDYYPKHAMYAVCYKGHWGFLQSINLRPVNEVFGLNDRPDSLELPEVLSATIPDCIGRFKDKDENCNLKLLISKTGAVKNIESGEDFTKADSMVLNAIYNIRFKPARLGGKPIDIWIWYPM